MNKQVPDYRNINKMPMYRKCYTLSVIVKHTWKTESFKGGKSEELNNVLDDLNPAVAACDIRFNFNQ